MSSGKYFAIVSPHSEPEAFTSVPIGPDASTKSTRCKVDNAYYDKLREKLSVEKAKEIVKHKHADRFTQDSPTTLTTGARKRRRVDGDNGDSGDLVHQVVLKIENRATNAKIDGNVIELWAAYKEMSGELSKKNTTINELEKKILTLKDRLKNYSTLKEVDAEVKQEVAKALAKAAKDFDKKADKKADIAEKKIAKLQTENDALTRKITLLKTKQAVTLSAPTHSAQEITSMNLSVISTVMSGLNQNTAILTGGTYTPTLAHTPNQSTPLRLTSHTSHGTLNEWTATELHDWFTRNGFPAPDLIDITGKDLVDVYHADGSGFNVVDLNQDLELNLNKVQMRKCKQKLDELYH